VRYQVVLSFFLYALLLTGCSPEGESSRATLALDQAESVDPLKAFGTTASNVFLYYRDVDAATEFYRNVLGFRVAADYGFAKIMQVAPKSFVTLVDETKGMHASSEPKTTTIALVTDNLDGWWNYIQTQNVALRSTEFNLVKGSSHDSFVAIDPEGYLLEFERFNDHAENRRLLPILAETPTLYPEPGTSNVPAGLGFKATVVWFYYKDMPGTHKFYEDVMGFDLLVDQGWTKIYRIGPSGYFGLVDEQRGMHRFTEEKAVTLSFFTDNIDGWYEYLSNDDRVEMRSKTIEVENEYRAFVAYDPAGYYLEWDVFSDIPVNAALVEMIAAP